MNTQDPFAAVRVSNQTKSIPKTIENDPFAAVRKLNAIESDTEDSPLKSWVRFALQAPQGALEMTGYGINTALQNLFGTGEALAELEELDDPYYQQQLREQFPTAPWENFKGIDREKYLQSVQEASESFPTIYNIGRILEESTGIPFTPKTDWQKKLRFAGSVGKATPGGAIQKISGSAIGSAAKSGLENIGVPEPISDIVGFGVGVGAGAKIPGEITVKTKPSGLKQRRFESLEKSRSVSPNKINQINEKLEQDFRNLSNKIVKESPIGETAENLANNPLYKRQSQELLNEAQNIADNLTGNISQDVYKKSIVQNSQKRVKGISPSEYDKNYSKYVKDSLSGIKTKKISAGQLVEQYRKNNASLREYFEPGSSKAVNNAKRDALLDQNRSIASIIEEKFPDSNLGKVFREGNERWSKIMDAEAVDGFVNELFKDGINYAKAKKLLDSEGYSFKFKRALGEEGYKNFEQLVQDFLTSERGYNMLRKAEQMQFKGIFSSFLPYLVSQDLGKATTGITLGKEAWRLIMNSMLDKPKIVLDLKKGVNYLKAGKISKAKKEFSKVKNQIVD